MESYQRVDRRAEATPAPPLWILAAAPSVWALHFLASYLTAAIWCAKAAGPLAGVRIAVAGYTGVALLGIGVVVAAGRRWRRAARGGPPHDLDLPRERTAFLGFATVLLSVLSAIAVLYVGAVAVVFENCR